jgi:hypothetical protein
MATFCTSPPPQNPFVKHCNKILFFWVVVVWNFSPKKEIFKNKITIWDFQCKFRENPQISNIWVGVFVMKFKFLCGVHFNSHLRTMSTPQSSSQQAAAAQEPKIQGLQIMGLFIHPSFQIFHGTHHKLHSSWSNRMMWTCDWQSLNPSSPGPPLFFFLRLRGGFSCDTRRVCYLPWPISHPMKHHQVPHVNMSVVTHPKQAGPGSLCTG